MRQLFPGSVLETRRSAIGQFFVLTPVTEPEVFAKPYLAKFPSHCYIVTNEGKIQVFLVSTKAFLKGTEEFLHANIE